MQINDLIELLQDAADQGITDVEVHTQINYPLKGGVYNVRVLDGKVAIAAGTQREYGDKAAWIEDDSSDCDEYDTFN
tara:strand:- start:576 stop:806 length:231 start_codon:yes stop_codon:yes gene_type:complete